MSDDHLKLIVVAPRQRGERRAKTPPLSPAAAWRDEAFPGSQRAQERRFSRPLSDIAKGRKKKNPSR